jgi:hypothetical protein
MNPRDRQQLLTVLASAAVGLLAGQYLLFQPLVRAWEGRAAEIASLRKSVTEGDRLLKRTSGPDGLRARWEGMRTNTFSPESSVAENQMLKAFDRWAQESRVRVNSLKPQGKRGDDTYATVECRVDAAGDLPALTRFLYGLENDPLGLRIDTVEIGTRDDKGEQLTLGLQVSGLILEPRSSQ